MNTIQYGPEWIKNVRKARRMTQAEAARACRLSHQLWRNWESKANSKKQHPSAAARVLLDIFASGHNPIDMIADKKV